MSFINISNNSHCKQNNDNVVCQILDPSFKNELMNINQSKDDIFNIYMNGYINSKNSIFNNFIALK